MCLCTYGKMKNTKYFLYFQCPLTCWLIMTDNYFILFILLLTLAPYVSPLKVFTLGENSKRSSVVEILNSSIHELDQFTICGRFLTSSFSTSSNVWQTILFKVFIYHIKVLSANQRVQVDMYFLAILTATSCDHFYEGCTKYYKDKLGKMNKGGGESAHKVSLQTKSGSVANHSELFPLTRTTIFFRLGNWKIGNLSASLPIQN